MDILFARTPDPGTDTKSKMEPMEAKRNTASQDKGKAGSAAQRLAPTGPASSRRSSRSEAKAPDLYEAIGFRQFLKEWTTWKKSVSPTFSLRQFAQHTGFLSHTFLPKVIDGSRNLTDESAQRIAQSLGLTKLQERFFLLLVRHDQCEDENERERLFIELSAMRRIRFQRRISAAQSNYYDQWFYPVLRQLAPCQGDDPDPAKIGAFLVPSVPGAMISKALADLEVMGLLLRKEKRWVAPDSVVSVDALPRTVKIKGRHDILIKGMESLHRFEPEERLTRCILLGLSDDAHEEILTILNEAGQRCFEIAARDERPSKIWQIILQAFPMSRNIPGAKETSATS